MARDGQGRLHLAVHRDGSGRARVDLTGPVFAEAWQNEIVAAAANTAHAVLGAAPDQARMVALASNAMAATSRLAEGFLARAPEGSVACRSGCDHCCHQSVGVTPPEALVIFEHLRNRLTEAELAAVVDRIAKLHARTRGLSSAQRFSPDLPCPLLEEGRCSVYEVRPLSCRGMNSLDAKECADRLRDPQAREAFIAQGISGRSYMEPIRSFHAVSAGLQLALSELYRLDMRPLDLTAALRMLFEQSESIVSAWLAGASSFEAARGGDSTNNPQARTLSGTLNRKPQNV